MKCLRRFLTLFVVVLLISAAIPVAAEGEAPFPTKAWSVSTPEEQGVSSKDLLALLTPFTAENFHFDSLVVVRNGYIIAEAYNAPYGPENTHQLQSTSKAVIAMGIGLALKDGLIKSLDEPMISFFPDRQIKNLDDRKKAITLRHMLTMSVGLECDDFTVPVDQWVIWKLIENPDPIQSTLDLPMVAEPGEKWQYCNMVTYLLAAIIGDAAGMPVLDYLDQKLFAPLGISEFTWPTLNGIPLGAGNLQLNTRDMAKLGYLLIQNGKWGDQQVLDAEYVKAMIGPSMQSPFPGSPYGYQLWTSDDGSNASAIGHGGQFIAILPEKGFVIVLTGSLTETNRVVIQSYPLLLGALALNVSDTPLAADEEAASALKSYLDGLANPIPQPVSPLSDVAKQISGVTYGLYNPNLFYPGMATKRYFDNVAYRGVDFSAKSVKLTFGGGDTATFNVTFADDKTFDVAVGLDNVYRTSPWRVDKVAAKGMWITPDTFRIYLRPLGSAFMHRLDISFVSVAVTIVTYEYVEGEALAIQGMAAQ